MASPAAGAAAGAALATTVKPRAAPREEALREREGAEACTAARRTVFCPTNADVRADTDDLRTDTRRAAACARTGRVTEQTVAIVSFCFPLVRLTCAPHRGELDSFQQDDQPTRSNRSFPKPKIFLFLSRQAPASFWISKRRTGFGNVGGPTVWLCLEVA
jgi:hypothetical protein